MPTGKNTHKNNSSIVVFSTHAIFAIQLWLGFIWIKSSLAKLASDTFVQTLGATLIKFSSQNPFLWYKQFLELVAIPNAKLLGQLTQWGELIAGLLLTLTAVLIWRFGLSRRVCLMALIGALIGFFLNLQFGLASFWMSAASETVNLVMGGTQIILVWFYGKLLKDSV